MADDHPIYVFEFQGKMELQTPSQQSSEEDIVKSLSKSTDKISDDIRSEIRKIFPRYTVQVEISFYEGSIIAIGTIVLATWAFLRPVVEESAKKALEPELTQLMQFAIKRVLSRGVAQAGGQLAEPIDMDVKPLSTSISTSSTSTSTSTSRSSGLLANQPGRFPYLMILTLVNTLVLLILLILLLLPHLNITIK